MVQQINQDARIKLVIQGGDQVYHDSIETECLTTLQSAGYDSATSTADESVARAIIRNYQHFYGHRAYRKIMASVPSVAMLDDHDITDGWGGRQDSFDDRGSLLPQWQRYFDLTYDAFKAYQTSKNPPFRIHNGSESTYLDFGKNRLFLLDLRREKNVKNLEEPLVSRDHEAQLLKAIETTPAHIAKVFVLSPVVPVRQSPDEEERLIDLTSAAFRWWGTANTKRLRGGWWHRKIWSLLAAALDTGDFATLTDDLTDSLSSKSNRKVLIALLQALYNLKSKTEISSYLLSGDVHTGGVSEIFIRDKKLMCVPQVVSSPIGYVPMQKLVKDETTKESEFQLSMGEQPATSNTVIIARNIFYRSDRNFCVIEPGVQGDRVDVEFHFESLSQPVFCKVPFLKEPGWLT